MCKDHCFLYKSAVSFLLSIRAVVLLSSLLFDQNSIQRAEYRPSVIAGIRVFLREGSCDWCSDSLRLHNHSLCQYQRIGEMSSCHSTNKCSVQYTILSKLPILHSLEMKYAESIETAILCGLNQSKHGFHYSQ